MIGKIQFINFIIYTKKFLSFKQLKFKKKKKLIIFKLVLQFKINNKKKTNISKMYLI